MKHTGKGKDRMGNGDEDGLRFTWRWFEVGKSSPGPVQACETITLPHWWRLKVDVKITTVGGIRYEPAVWRENKCLMSYGSVKARIDAQRLAESLLESLLADSLRDCFGYAIEIHEE